MKLIKNLVSSTLILLSFSVHSQDKTFKNSDETKAFSMKISENFSKMKIEESFTELKKFWPMPENEIDGLEEKTLKYLNLLEDRFGKSNGVVKIKEEAIKDFAIRETYIVKYSFSAIRLVFTYYKSENGWIVNSFKWDDSFSEEFK